MVGRRARRGFGWCLTREVVLGEAACRLDTVSRSWINRFTDA